MPRLWSYLIKKFITLFLLTLVGIISFLLVIRFSSIAGFATSGTSIGLIFKFIIFLIPYVLPLAISISTLNAALSISRKLSAEKQITALRSGGLSVKAIFLPLLFVFVCLSMLNFLISGTLAPLSKLKSKVLIHNTTLDHPLFITQKACPVKVKSLYTDVGKMSSKDTAHDLILAFKNKKNERLSLILADKLSVKGGLLKGKNLAIISSLKASDPLMQDDLVIENEALMTTSTQVVETLLYNDENVYGLDYLDFFQVLKKAFKKKTYLSELFKRLNISFAPLTFGFLGLCFGLNISRRASFMSLAIAIGLATLFMVVMASLRSFRSQPYICLTLYSFIQGLMLLASLLKLRRINKGES